MHRLYIETFGCQMNVNDTNIVQSIMQTAGFELVDSVDSASVIFLNTCSVRDNAEEKVHNRLNTLYHLVKKRNYKTVLGVLGCMAERLQDKLFNTNNIVSLVVGPDEYKKLPHLVELCFEGSKEIATDLSSLEDYNDVLPYRQNFLSASISIMRGCNNFCSYCVVPYTRGRERSRSNISILKEIELLSNQNIKEVTLLGQNVNSYLYNSLDNAEKTDFPKLLADIAKRFPHIRIRFLTSHPRNMSSDLVDTIAKYDNICNYIHLPVQSGSDRILKLMNRKYTAEHYLGLIAQLKQNIKDIAISTDIIAGYPSETLEDHKATIDLLKEVRYSNAFMFRYSPRSGTKAFDTLDDVPEEDKIHRLNEIIALQNQISKEENQKEVGKTVEILVEKATKRNSNEWSGKTKTAKLVIFDNSLSQYKAGDIVNINVIKTTSATLIGAVAPKETINQ